MDDQLIGREHERAQLEACLAEARAGRGSLVLLAGEAGVGKTTLARRVLAGSGFTVLEGFGIQAGTPAYGPVVEVLRSHLRSDVGGRLIEGPLAAHLALLLPELGPPGPEGDRATLFEAIRSHPWHRALPNGYARGCSGRCGLPKVLSQRVVEGAALEPSRRGEDGARSTAPLIGSTVEVLRA